MFQHIACKAFFFPTVLLLFLSCGLSIAGAQHDLDNSDVKRSIKTGNYPWYNEVSDTPNFQTEFPVSNEAETKKRNSVRKSKANAGVAPVAGTMGMWGVIGWLVSIGLIVALAIGAVIWLLLKMEPGGVNRYQDDEKDNVSFGSDRIEQLPFDVANTKGDFLSAAEQAANAGRYGEAMTNLFSHVLLTLDKHGKVRLKRGKTNRQYSGELTPHQNLKPYYERVMVFFESTFFGRHDIEKHQFELCWNELPKFQQELQNSSGGRNG